MKKHCQETELMEVLFLVDDEVYQTIIKSQ